MKKSIIFLFIFVCIFLLFYGCSLETNDIIQLQKPNATPLFSESDVITREGRIYIPSLNLGKYIPPHTGGDRDFHGNGPRVTVRANLYLKRVNNIDQLWLSVYMQARETKSDWTEARGTRQYWLLQTSSFCLVGSDNYSSFSYTDTDHSDDSFFFGNGELVRKLIITGDTKGNEAGSRTGVTVITNGITLRTF